jgi:hypothetical protein
MQITGSGMKRVRSEGLLHVARDDARCFAYRHAGDLRCARREGHENPSPRPITWMNLNFTKVVKHVNLLQHGS